MSWLPADTTEEARAVQTAIWRRLGGPGRLRLAMRMSDEARQITASGIGYRHPEYDAAMVRHALQRMVLGDALFAAAFPDVPLLAP